MSSSIDGLRAVSSSSEASRSSSTSSRRSGFPSDLNGSSNNSWTLKDACNAIEKLSRSCHGIPIATLGTKNYKCSSKDIDFLKGIFGGPSCSSPWKQRGIEMVFVILLFLIIIGLIIFWGPGSLKESWVFWGVLLIVFIIILLGLNWWSINNSGSDTCQV